MNFNLNEVEKQTIIRAFIHNHGNRNITAKALGISRPNFYYKIKKYKISLQDIEIKYNFIGYKRHTAD